MITYVQGGFFASPAQALVNPVNTVGMMGRGLALEFRRSFPAMFAQYQRYCRNKELAPGVLHVHQAPNKVVVNLPTKRHWKPASRLEDVQAGLRTFVEHVEPLGLRSVSFPQLGCGTGGLDWERQVRPVMERFLDPLPIAIYVHIQDDGTRADAIFPAEDVRGRVVPSGVLSQECLTADIRNATCAPPLVVQQVVDLLAVGNYLSRWSLPGGDLERTMHLLTSLRTLPYMMRIGLCERPGLAQRVGAIQLDPRWMIDGAQPVLVDGDVLLWPQVPSAVPMAI